MPEITKEKPIITRSDVEPEGVKPTEGLGVPEIPVSPAEKEMGGLGEAWNRLRERDPETYAKFMTPQPASETAPVPETPPAETMSTQPQPKEKISPGTTVAPGEEGQSEAAALEEKVARNKE